MAIGRIAYRLGLALLAVYLYSQSNEFWIVCALLLAWSFFQQQIAAIVGVIGRVSNIPLEHDANSVLIYTFSVEKVLEHRSVDALFNTLQENGKAPAPTLAEWRALLLESYARKYAPAAKACEVRFNIKSNLLFLNGEVDFGDHIYHELEIPYRWENGEPVEKALLQPYCEAALAVRMIVVNGLLHLQVGRFDKDYSPQVLHSGSLAVYETFATITSFPLMYFSSEHGIPVRYLNLVAAATPSYKTSYDDRVDKKKRSKDRDADWQSLNREIAGYRLLCDEDNPNYNYKGLDELSKAFMEKREKLLATEGYQTDKHDDEDSWRYPDTGHSYWNEYGQVFFRNMNANRDSPRAAHWFTDYYEEEP
ncbi:MAG TPA: hypothetical protein VJB15_00600 [Rhodothermia bacterium]|nr:hypothetical protein [Rhodothermia bacterium]